MAFRDTARMHLRNGLRSLLNRMGYEIVRDRDATLIYHLPHLLRRLRINGVIDVGANWGQFGRMLRETGYTGRIVSFEPVSYNAEVLRRLSADDPGWQVHQIALGREAGTAPIFVTKETVFSSFLEPNAYATETFAGKANVVGQEIVAVERLDAFTSEIVQGLTPPRLLLKTDTQGYDLDVLAGATGMLDQVHALVAELSLVPVYDGMPSYLDALRAFHDLGFDITGLFPVNRDSHDLRVIEYDAVLVRSTSQKTRGGAAS